MSSGCVMGDYNYGISSNVSALSPADYKHNLSSKSFFSNDPVTHTMQDELVENTTSKQTDSPQMNGDVSNGDGNLDDLATKNDDSEPSVNSQLDKQIIETSSGNSSTSLQLEFSDSSITTSAPSFWSGLTGEESFNAGISPIKNNISFPNISNPFLNSNVGPQIPQSLPTQRRAITGAHNFGPNRHQPQSSILKAFSNWSNPQSTSWSAPQTPNGLLPWNSMNLTSQKRMVPNINPVCTQKKTPPAIGQHSMVISPSKFRRSTSLPLGKQFPHSFGGVHGFDMSTHEENRDGNLVYPYQDHQLASNINSNSIEGLRFPLEQQLLDSILRSSNPDNQDHFKGYLNYAGNNIQNIGSIQDISIVIRMNLEFESTRDVSYP